VYVTVTHTGELTFNLSNRSFAPAPLTSCVAQLSAKILRKLVERNAAQQKWT
jgi:hypothetical protein